MNEHEITRIAEAMNRLRPDWPVASLRTLLNGPDLRDRPRRDVTVALAWVACEAATHTPARVLNAGPWWKAAAIEGAASNRDNPDKAHRCSVCSLSFERCRQVWSDDHDYESAAADHKRSPDAQRAIVQDMKARLELTKPPPPPREHKADPRVAAARAALPDPIPANQPTAEVGTTTKEADA